MKATLILCDAAQVDSSGKVHILGAGWTVVRVGVGVPLPAQALVAIVHVPWHQTVTPHLITLRLQDADGRPVLIGPDSERQTPLVHEQVLEVRRPSDVPEGITFDVPVVVAVGPGLWLTEGRYSWRLEIDGTTDEEWLTSFHVRVG